MKKLILCIICAILPLFGKNEFFTDTVADNFDKSSNSYTCASKPKSGKYETEIIGYDFENGIVKCRVRSEDDTYETYRSFNANKQFLKESFSYIREKNMKVINDDIKKKVESSSTNFADKVMENVKQIASDLTSTQTSEKIQPETSVDTDKINLSHYLASLATLQNIKPTETAGTTEKYDFNLEIDDLETKIDFTIAQAMNQANIEYFRELYYGMNEIYIHLQNLLFIIVGGFFLATLGGQKIQKYLENRGQSTGQKEPYLHKFFIPLLCAGVFYMPTTDSSGVNSTIVQNIIRYFTNEATTIADKASRIGLAKYTKKFDKEHNIRMQVEQPKQIIFDKQKLLYVNIKNHFLEQINTELKKCKNQYSEDEKMKFFDEIDERWLVQSAKKELESAWYDGAINFFKSFGAKFMTKEANYPTISLEACKYLVTEQARYSTALAILEKQGKKAEEISSIVDEAVKNKSKEEEKAQQTKTLETTSEKVFKILNRNETEYGWLNSLIAPASVMLLNLQRDAKMTLEFDSKKDITKLLDDKKIATMKSLGEEADEEKKIAQAANYIFDKVIVFMLPGSKSIFDTVYKTDNNLMKAAFSGYVLYNMYERGYTNKELVFVGSILLHSPISQGMQFVGDLMQTNTSSINPFNILGGLISSLGKGIEKLTTPNAIQEISKMFLGLSVVYFLYMDILEKLPLIIVSISGILAFITYFVSLCKYYYISPFVVAFALTTKRVDKIINFLMIGITIFFKPVLIVLFIYLALFLHGIVYELFIITSVSQFNSIMASSIGENSINIGTQFTIGIIKTLLQLFGSLGSCYIVWKTIMTGPDWVFKMLGLETSATSEATQQLAGKLEQKAVVI